ncbi:MAG: alpha/beta fold hydrolase [Opitutaceae bacterium]
MNILALHGFTGLGSDYLPFSKTCLGDWYAPDLPGHGTASDVDCSVQSTIECVQRWSAALPSGTRILVGYSMGARAALNHIVNHPDVWQGLILISANPGIEASDQRQARKTADENLAKRIEGEGVAPFLDFWQSLPIIRTQQAIQSDWLSEMKQNRLAHSSDGLAASLQHFGQGVCPNLWPKVSQIRVPVLCLTGKLDLKYRSISERMREFVPTLRHVEIAGAGHMPHLEKPQKSRAAINEFLKQFASK